jgi:hypothetical protein
MGKYEKGKRYRVIKPGARLDRIKHLGGSSFGTTRAALNVGDIIESEGYIGGWGSDNIEIANFAIVTDGHTVGADRGEFEPNSWGTPINGYLQEVTE